MFYQEDLGKKGPLETKSDSDGPKEIMKGQWAR